MPSSDITKPDNPLLMDVTNLNALLKAMRKLDFSEWTDLENGTWQLDYDDQTNTVIIQVLKNGVWTKAGTLDINATSIDGFSATQTIQANTIPVRNAQGIIPGDITGNANSADTAQALSEVNPIGMGGTGADSLPGARNNLGITELEADVEALDIAKFDKSGGKISGVVSIGGNEEHLFYLDNGRAVYRATYEPNSYWYLSVSASGWNFNNASVYNLLDVSTKTITLSGAGAINSTNAFISINTALTIGLEQYHYLYKDALGAGVWRVRTPNGQYVYITGDNTGFSFNGSSLVSINDLSCNTVYAQNAQLSGALSVPSITADAYYLSDGREITGTRFPYYGVYNYYTPTSNVDGTSTVVPVKVDAKMVVFSIPEEDIPAGTKYSVYIYYPVSSTPMTFYEGIAPVPPPSFELRKDYRIGISVPNVGGKMTFKAFTLES